MQRMGMVIGLQQGKVAQYKALHAAVWPEILALISACNITQYSIFLKEPENLLFGHGPMSARISQRTWRRWRPIRAIGMVGCVHALASAAGNAERG